MCTVTPPVALNFHANHFFRVRGWNPTGWGAWSAGKLFDYLDNGSDDNSVLTNGGFESSTNDWFSCSDSGTTTTSTDSTEGSSSLAIGGADCLYQEFTIAPNTSYTVQCDAKATGYADMTLTVMDSGYNSLDSDVLVIDSSTYQSYSTSITAPAAGAIGAVTFYSEGSANFDACTVVEGV